MEIVYLLMHKETKRLYIGRTNNLKRRLLEHRTDKRGYDLIYAEAYLSRKDAVRREINLKKFKSAYHNLKKRISFSLLEFSEGGGRSERAPVTV